MRRLAVGVAVGMVAGWLAAPGPAVITEPYVVVQVVEMAPAVHEGTPIADSLLDWAEVDRQTDCLWDFLQERQIELTLSNIVTAGDWTDMHGGACAVMGRDSDEVEG